jgi:hypothetical protein
MLNSYFRYLLYFTIIASAFSCKKPYFPPATSTSKTYLIVEGVISSGSAPTVINLSRTVSLTSVKTANPVTGAILTVESDRNDNYVLTETGNGSYTSSSLTLDNSKKYRLRIKTPDNNQYLSDFIGVLNSPPLDSVSYKITGDGVNIYSNTHDVKNSTRYYRWDFQETWIIHANYASYYKSNGDTVLARDLFNDNIYQCWASGASSSIILNSSAKLVNDVIVDNPITAISSTSEKLGSKYSILVRQYALTGAAYSFWENLKKNTEQLGSVFDAQPSQINGNIHSVTNPSESVIGYLSVGNAVSQRIFISNQQLPNWRATPAYPDCQLDTFLYKYFAPSAKTPVNQVDIYINYKKNSSANFIPVNPISPPGAPRPIGFTASTRECVDCTLRGTNKQPAFWK